MNGDGGATDAKLTRLQLVREGRSGVCTELELESGGVIVFLETLLGSVSSNDCLLRWAIERKASNETAYEGFIDGNITYLVNIRANVL